MLQKVNCVLLVIVVLAVVGLGIEAAMSRRRSSLTIRELTNTLADTTRALEQARSATLENDRQAREVADMVSMLDESVATLKESRTADQAASERAESQALTEFLQQLLIAADIADRSNGASTRQTLIHQALRHADEIAATDPETAATIRSAMERFLAQAEDGAAAGAPASGEAAREAAVRRASPYPALRWIDELPYVRWDGPWYQVLKIDDTPIEDIIAFCERQYPGEARKRFSEELVQVLTDMGPQPGDTVSLRLKERETGSIIVVPNSELSVENHEKLMEFLRAQADGL